MNLLATLAAYSSSSYDYDDIERMLMSSSSSSDVAAAGIWMIIATILSIVGGLLIYFLFVKKKEEPKGKFAIWLKKFLSFDTMWVEDILKIAYIVGTLSLTLTSFSFLGEGGYGVLLFLIMLTLGNLVVRVVYEFMLILIMIWRNTTDIKNKK